MKLKLIGGITTATLFVCAAAMSRPDEREVPDEPEVRDECAATAHATANMSDNILLPGPHTIELDTISPVAIHVSEYWGGGMVQVDPGSIAASLTIERMVNPDGTYGLDYQITELVATVEPFEYPGSVDTGDNVFQLATDSTDPTDPLISRLTLSGESGTVRLQGSANLILLNPLFPDSSPATARVMIEGTYDFENQVADVLLDARARSPSVDSAP